MMEEGQQLKDEGKEMEFGTFEHLGNAMHNINNINADNRAENDECEDSYEESDQNAQYVGQTEGEHYGEFNVVVSNDSVRGSVNRNFTASNRQSRVNISV
jgi:hypothetical protein